MRQHMLQLLTDVGEAADIIYRLKPDFKEGIIFKKFESKKKQKWWCTHYIDKVFTDVRLINFPRHDSNDAGSRYIFPYIFRILSISGFFVSGVFAVSADFFDTLRCVFRLRISPTISAWLLINLI